LDLVREHLEQSLATDLTTWERADCHRMMAMALGAQGCNFERDVMLARRLFDYGSRTQASADVLRTEAACALLSDDRATAQQRLRTAIAEHRGRGQRQGVVQSAIVLALLNISPRLARRLVTP
jgi:hypothetical protein